MVVYEYMFLASCRESDITKERIERVLKAGANVVLTTKGIDDMSLKASSYRQHYVLALLLVFFLKKKEF